MPIYAYKCSNCGFEKDELQKMSAAPLVDCPSCGQPALKKQLTAAGFQLKGSGWYVTDFRDGSKAPATAVAPATTAADAATGAKSADTAPAAKSGESSSSSGDAKPATSEGGKPAGTASPAPASPAVPAAGS